MNGKLRSALALASFLVAFENVSKAALLTASLFTAIVPPGTVTVPIAVAGVAPGSATLTGPGYTVTFSVAAGEGVEKGDTLLAALPVAGVTGGAPEFLTGDFGSGAPLTTSIAAAGDYFSTGLGTITITFTTPQTAFALLWGSIDASNSLTFNDAAHDVITGTAVQAAAAGFVSNGFQGPGGSAYVIVNTATPFTTVTATSGVVSFEFAGAVGANTPLVTTPEPGSVTLMLGSGLVGVGFIGLRLRRK